MQHAERRATEPFERAKVVEIADDGHDAMRAQLARFLGTTGQADQSHAAAQQLGGAQGDVTATDQEYA